MKNIGLVLVGTLDESNVTLSRHTHPFLRKAHQTKHDMASSIEDTLIKLDKCHSVDYNNDEVKLIKSKIEAIAHDISTRIGASNSILSNTVVQCGSFIRWFATNL